jgi:hypothetical protein
MSVRLGTVEEGAPYGVKFEASLDSTDVSLVLVGWVPAHGSQPQAWAMRVEPGELGNHALSAPVASSYYAIQVDVDVPDGQAGGTLAVSGLTTGVKTVAVKDDETFLIQIVRRAG